jgi:hypothetical protein
LRRVETNGAEGYWAQFHPVRLAGSSNVTNSNDQESVPGERVTLLNIANKDKKNRYLISYLFVFSLLGVAKRAGTWALAKEAN